MIETFSFPKYQKINSLFKRDPKTHDILKYEFSETEFQHLYETPWTIKEKIDGTNIRIGWTGEKVIIGGRTENSQLPCGLLDRLQKLFTIEKFKALTYPPMIIYGEGVGVKIQSNGRIYLLEHDYDFIAFDILIERWQDMEQVEKMSKSLQIRSVRWGLGRLTNIIVNDEFLYESHFPDLSYIPEGIVAVPVVGFLNKHGGRIITKLKVDDFNNPDYCFRTQTNNYYKRKQ